MNYYIFLLSFAFAGIFLPEPEPTIIIEKRLAGLVHEFVSIKYSNYIMKEYIYVGVKRQRLYLISDTTIILSFPISTAKNGVGSEKLSEKTPLGLHKIKSMVGENVPINGIILGSSYTGKTATIISEAKSGNTDDVTTRAMRLEGLENKINKGGNKDSYSREIYIHGTPEEGLIGTPVSHGCIRMKNKDVITLFDRVKTGTYVIILNN